MTFDQLLPGDKFTADGEVYIKIATFWPDEGQPFNAISATGGRVLFGPGYPVTKQ